MVKGFDYTPLTKTFSPAWDRRKYIKNIKGLSDEFCHNIYRIIMRPNTESTPHWFKEAGNWLYKTVSIKLAIKEKPIWMIFAFILDSNSKEFRIGSNSELLYHIVKDELMYGSIQNSDLKYIESKVKDLYSSFDPTKEYSFSEFFELYYNWYKSINNAKLDIKVG